MTPLTIGAIVHTSDDGFLGTVGDAQGGFFLVDARPSESYWLKRSYVGSSTKDRVTLNFTKDELSRYRADTFDVSNMPEAPVGAEVVTLDGKKLGKVKVVEAGFFKVDVPRHHDYWFQREMIGSSSSEKVTMEFADDDVKLYAIKFPNDELPVGAIPGVGEVPDYPENDAIDALAAERRQTGGTQMIDGPPHAGR
jgi:hypothetical protein